MDAIFIIAIVRIAISKYRFIIIIIIVFVGWRLLPRLAADMCNRTEPQEGDIGRKTFVNLSE